MTLDPEERQPEDEGDEDGEAGVDECSGTHIGIDAGADKEQPREQRRHDTNQDTQHPRGEKRADDVDLWSHHPPILWPRTLVLRRVAGCEGQRSGGIHELELRVDLDEPGTAQLAARSQEVGQGAETMRSEE